MKNVFMVLCATVFLLANFVFADEVVPVKRPVKMLAGYLGFNPHVMEAQEMLNQFAKPMARAGFNTMDIKIHPSTSKGIIDLKNPKVYANLKALADGIDAEGMMFTVYVYARDERQPQSIEADKFSQPCVDDTGKTLELLFNLADYNSFKAAMANVFIMAEASKTMPIGAVKIDIEVLMSAYSYDDQTWGRFVKENPSFHVSTPIAERLNELKKNVAEEKYQIFYVREYEKNVQQFEKEVHKINPKLMLGMMPMNQNWLSNPFIKNLATKEAPAIIDDWSMYNGDGYDRNSILRQQSFVLSLNPNNLYIPWLRLNTYKPEQIPAQLYHAALENGGYNIWCIDMLDPKVNALSGYGLPNGVKEVQYYEAFSKVNKALNKDFASAKSTWGKRIAYVKLPPPLQPLNLNITVPNLVPKGNGTGANPGFVLRDQQTVFIYAEKGEKISAKITHLAGAARKVALHFCLLDKDGKILVDEGVSPYENGGATGSEYLNFPAPYSGTYALTISGGVSGMAWYSVVVNNPHYGLRTENGVYFFMTATFKIYLLRGGLAGPAWLDIFMEPPQVANVEGFKLPLELVETSKKVELPSNEKLYYSFSKPERMRAGQFAQDVVLTPRGAVLPYIFDNPERALAPAK